MSTVTFHEGLGQFGQVITQIDFANLTLNGFGNTATLTDPNGVKIVIQGTNMGYSPGETSWYIAVGTVVSLQVLDAGDAVLFEVTDTDADAAWLYNQIVTGQDMNIDLSGGPGRLWGTDNIVFGSDADEVLMTGAGDDEVTGGDGRDKLGSTGGDDTMTGGRGADWFLAQRPGTLVITDFRDDGPLAQQDQIILSRWQYRHLEITQVGDDTHLANSTIKGSRPEMDVILLNFDMSTLDRTDFTFQM